MRLLWLIASQLEPALIASPALPDCYHSPSAAPSTTLSTPLHPSPAQLWLVWPFLGWGVVLVVSYAIAYTLLHKVGPPIALFNMVSTVMVLYNRNLFYLQELVFEMDVTKIARGR